MLHMKYEQNLMKRVSQNSPKAIRNSLSVCVFSMKHFEYGRRKLPQNFDFLSKTKHIFAKLNSFKYKQKYESN